MRRASVYKENFRFVWNCLRRFGVASPDLEDATHDVFVVAFRRCSEFALATSARGWLFGVIRRVASNYRRSAGRRARRLAAVRDVQPGATRPERDLERTDAARVVGRFLDGLAEPQRDVFVLMELEQMTAREVGELLDLNPNTASARLRAARKAFDRFAAKVREENGWDGESAVAHLQRPANVPSDARTRVGAALGASLSSISKPIAVGLTSWAKAAAIGLALGGGSVAAVAGVASAMGPPSSSLVPAMPPVEPLPRPPRVAKASVADAQTPEPAPITEASEEPRLERPAPPPKPRRPGRPVQRPEDDSREQLERQTALLARARSALKRGDASEVLRATTEYRQQFASGPFSAEIALLEIRGHCAGGNTNTARALGKHFERAHPDSAHLAVLERTCAASITKPPASGN
ncbi:MAG: sigma-70 family RNA polymerase sigma factor [Nannocystaceae bacterium]|nr:sigma-70 family RNA polymerase sigma factor [bacterium]